MMNDRHAVSQLKPFVDQMQPMTDKGSLELVEKLWRRRHELTEAEWLEAAPILLGMLVAATPLVKLRERIVELEAQIERMQERNRQVLGATENCPICHGPCKRKPAHGSRQW